ncbi:zinc finger and BTB domain-containing protein 17-like [Folsomia candida]|uniref:zinc finger and BTB domain-containing protein 17-like n=1 Tax=Folsomia candida TaxID=158441 RepID=UPI0016055D0E|nr:zinc finger and BTB domain-containing protein 17-like [Folsomia candida]
MTQECPHCPKSFTSTRSLSRNLATHDDTAQIKCQICRKTLKNRGGLSTHLSRIHNNRKIHRCAICLRNYASPGGLENHVAAVHTPGPRPHFPCKFLHCDKKFVSKGALTNHFKVVHSENPVRFRCTLCSKELKSKASLMKHIAIHTTEKPFKCAECGHSFVDMSDLSSHEETHREKSVRNRIKCHLCPITFLTRTGKRLYVQNYHEDQSKYPCPICDKRLKTANNLKFHVEAKHTTDKELRYACDQCEYKSWKKFSLRKHVKRRHVEGRGTTCYFCGRNYSAFTDLVRHCSFRHTLEK